MEINIMGIYKVTNKVNNKIYIGSSVDIGQRWKQHIRDLRKSKHDNKHPQNAWVKYGEDNFKFEIIEIVNDSQELFEKEQQWINKTRCFDGNIGYNISINASRPSINKDLISTHLNCNLIFKDKAIEIVNMKLETNEKLIYYVLRDFIEFPLNCILIKGEVPVISELESIVNIKERTIRKALKGLEEKDLVKLQSVGVRKAIFFNPKYYASGMEIEKRTLDMFGLSKDDILESFK